MDEDFSSDLGSLLDQLKDNNTAMKSVQKESNPLKKEDIEKFVIERAGTLVDESLEMVKMVKDYITSAPETDSVEALAGLVTATSSALETLNKIIVADKKSETIFKAKELDARYKRELIEDITKSKVLATREEMLKQLALQTTERRANSIEVETLSGQS